MQEPYDNYLQCFEEYRKSYGKNAAALEISNCMRFSGIIVTKATPEKNYNKNNEPVYSAHPKFDDQILKTKRDSRITNRFEYLAIRVFGGKTFTLKRRLKLSAYVELDEN